MASSIMAATSFVGADLLDWLSKVFMGVRIEIAFFCLAICTQALLFGATRVRVRRDTAKAKGKTEKTSEGKQGGQQNAHGPLTFSLSQAVRSLRGSGCDSNTMARRLGAELRGCSSSEVSGALIGLLEGGLSKPAGVDLLDAVRCVLRERGLAPDVQLGHLLLRGYFDARSMERFSDFLRELEAMKVSAPNINLLALKAALRTSDLKAAMLRFQVLRSLWQGSDGCTPSTAPRALLEQLVQLASAQGQLSVFLDHVSEPRLSPAVLEAVLAESARCGDAAILARAEGLARKQGLTLQGAAFVSLLKGATCPTKALQLLEEACSRDYEAKAFFIAALESPAAKQGNEVADSVLSSAKKVQALGSEVAVALLQQILDRAATAEDSDSAVLDMYAAHLPGLNLSTGGGSGERIVAEAALRCSRPDVLNQLFAASTETAPRLALIKSLGAQKRLADAKTVFNACTDKPAPLHNALLEACIQSEDAQAAQKVMGEATQAGVADVVSYNTQIKVPLKSSNMQQARSMIQNMRATGVQPNVVTFNELMDATVAKNPEAIWDIVKEMRQCNMKPNLVTCSILLKSIRPTSRTADLDRVLALVEATGESMDEVLLSSVVEASVRIGHITLLRQILKKQRTAKKVVITCAHTYGSLIRACGVVKDVAAAWQIWKEMREQQVKVTSITLGCMVEALAMNGSSEAAYGLVQELSQDARCCDLVNSVIYGSILKGFAHQRDFKRVWAVHDEMIARKVEFTSVTFNILIDACARNRDMSRMSEILKEIDRQGVRINIVTYSAIVKAYCHLNRLPEAFKMVDDMRRTTEFKPDEIMYNTLLDGCARQGLYDRGMALLEQMQQEDVRPTNFTLSVLVKLACRSRSNQIQRAFELVEELPKKYRFKLNVHVFNNLVQVCTVHRDIQRALSTLERMLTEKVRPDARTYSLLLHACVECGSAQDAAGLLRAAMGLRGLHPILSKFPAAAYQPHGGLPTALLEEILEGLVGPNCRNEPLALALLRELRRLEGLQLDPKLQLRLTTHAFTS